MELLTSRLLWLSILLTLSLTAFSCKFEGSDSENRSVPIEPSGEFLDRKAAYLAYCNANNGPGSGGIHGQVCRAYMGETTYNEGVIYQKLTKINNREDCSDFDLNSVLRVLLLDRANPSLPDQLRRDMEQTALDFKYWLDEPGPDEMCWWSENHQILFHTAELLAGILFPDTVFSNSGMTGRDHMEHARPLLHKWLDYRGRMGFDEWHSNVYFNEDMPPLINLVDFADEESIRIKAAMLMDVLTFDLISNYYKGNFATTHGRTYPNKLLNGLSDSTKVSSYILAGLVPISTINELGASDFTGAYLATSDHYWPAALLEDIAIDSRDSIEHCQRDSITFEEAADWGIGFESHEDIMFWWGLTGYVAPLVIEGTFNMVEYYNMWNGFTWKDLQFLRPFVGDPVLRHVAEALEPLSRGATLESISTYTYRTPYYQLSGAQDWKPGSWTGQVHIWKATIDKNTYIFTTYPGGSPLGEDIGGQWTGGFVPRATIYKNVGVFQYHLPELPGYIDPPGLPIDWNLFLVDYNHAYFPKSTFDEVIEFGNWTMGRKGDAYAALYSEVLPRWSDTVDYELIAPSPDNVWILEMGDVESNGSFADFVAEIINAAVSAGDTAVYYESPSLGTIEVGWTGPMAVNSAPVDLGPYPRWDNPYCYQQFGTDVTSIEYDGMMLQLDFSTPRRFVKKKKGTGL